MKREKTFVLLASILLLAPIAKADEAAAEADASTDVVANNQRVQTQGGQEMSESAAASLANASDLRSAADSKKLEQLDFSLAMATIALRRGNIPEAKKQVEYGLTFADDNSQLWYLSGLVRSAEENWENAVESFKKAKDLDSARDVSFELANAYYHLGKLAEAGEALNDCHTVNCNMLHGFIALDAEEYSEAVTYFDKSADAASDSQPEATLPAVYYSAATKLAMGSFKEARATLNKSYALSKKHAPWAILYAGLKRNLQLFNFYGALGFHFDSNINRISDVTIEQLKLAGKSNMADLRFDIQLAGNFRYFFTNNLRMNLNIGFNQQLYLLEGPDTRAFNMTSIQGGLSLAYGWGKRPTLNYVSLSYNIVPMWVLGEAHKYDVGLDFFALAQELGPTVNLTLGKGTLNAGYKLLIDHYDDTALVPGVQKDARNDFINRLHASYMHRVVSSLSLGGALNSGYANAKSDEFDRGFFGANFRLVWAPTYRGTIGADIGYSLNKYARSSMDRLDNQLNVSVQLASLLNRFMNMGIDVMYTHRWSTVDIYEYDRILVGFNVAWTL